MSASVARPTQATMHLASLASLASLAALAALASLLVGGTAAAQTPPASPAPARIDVRVPRGWSLAILTEGGWEDNVRFERPDGLSDRMTGGSVTVSDAVYGARSTIGFRAAVAAKHYQRLTDLNRVSYDAYLTGRRAFTPRLDATADAGYRSTLSTQLPRFSADAGATALADGAGPTATGGADGTGSVLAPLSVARTFTLSAASSYLLTPHAAAVGAIGFASTRFEQSTMLPASAVTGSMQFAHFFGNGAVLLRGAALHGSSQGHRSDTQTLAAGLESVWGRVTTRLFAGATRMDTVGTPAFAPTGNVELGSVFGRSSATLRYARTAGLAAGLGRLLLSHEAGGTYDFHAGQSTLLELEAARGWNTDPAVSDQPLVTTSVLLGLRRTFRSGLTLDGSVSHRRRDQGVGLSGTATRLGLGYRLGGP